MSEQASLMNVSFTESLEYPYIPREMDLRHDDLYDRPIHRLIASFVIYAKRFLVGRIGGKSLHAQFFEVIVRMCEEKMLQADFDVLIRKAPMLKTSRIVCPRTDLSPLLEDSRTYDQVIIADFVSKTKWMICLVSLVNHQVDLYLVGDIETSESKPFMLKLRNALAKAFPENHFTLKFRLHIPLSFKRDPILVAYLLSLYLHRHWKYLDLDEDTILLHKFKALEDYRQLHDKSLGSFEIDKITTFSHPFISRDWRQPATEKLDEIEEKGWIVIDVNGDGNCGYYSLIVGMENNRNFEIAPKRKMTADSMIENTVWQDSLLNFRKQLHKHSRRLLKKIEPLSGEKPDWMSNVIANTKEEVSDLSNNIFSASLSREEYFEDLPEQYQMNAFWLPFVFASLYSMRVVIIMRYKGSNSVDLTTNIFDSIAPFEESNVSELERPHLSFEQKPGVYRIPDEDFKEKPTIELLFNTGVDEPGHIMFLRRILCDEATLIATTRLSKSLGQNLRLVFTQNDNFLPSEVRPGRVPIAPGNVEALAANEPDELELGRTENDALIPLDVTPVRVHDAAVNVEALIGTGHSDGTILSPGLPSGRLTAVVHVADHLENPRSVTESINATISPNARNLPPANRSPSPVFHIAQHQDNPRKRKESTSNDEIPQNNPKKKKRASIQVSRPGAVIGNDEVSQNSPKRKQQASDPNKIAEKRRQGSSARPATDPNEDELAIEEEIEKLHSVFDEKFKDGTSKHKTAAQMYYDSRQRHFLIRTFEFDKKKYSSERKVTNVEKNYDEFLVAMAKKYKNHWVGCSPGDPGDGHPAPDHLATKILTIYQQHNDRHCLAFSLASALFHVGFKEEASVLASSAKFFHVLPFDRAISSLLEFMENLVPEIGRATVFERRCNTHSRALRRLSWESLFNDRVPFPTVVIPVLPDGTRPHAFCVVDDLIFDSINQYALKLCQDSLDWIFNDSEVKIYLAIRFATKVSQGNSKIPSVYSRPAEVHWDHPSPYLKNQCHRRVPECLVTRIPSLYLRHNERFCLTLSLASALFYCGFEAESLRLASKAAIYSKLSFTDTLASIKELMLELVPEIGKATEFPSKNKKRKQRRDRLTWENLLNETTPFPTIIIPMLSDGRLSYAFCVVDDLIFHSISPYAFKLQKESLDWIFDNNEVRIHKATRFATKFSPPNEKTQRNYTRRVAQNWNRASG